MSREDKELATELVYGCLRWRLQLDCVLEKATTQGRLKLNRHLRWAFRIGAYQLVYIWTESPPMRLSTVACDK